MVGVDIIGADEDVEVVVIDGKDYEVSEEGKNAIESITVKDFES